MERYTNWQWSSQTTTLVGGSNSTLYFIHKRILDVALATIALILLFPLLLIIPILIKLDTPGPILFVQERVGSRRRSRDGDTLWEIRNFPVYKFRSMVKEADASLHQAYVKAYVEGKVEASAESGTIYQLIDDPRVTKVGRILRRASLDELPQLFNVLRGEMSLVGPRPVPEYEVAEYREAWHYERLATLPGLTGLWQVKGRGEIPFEDMVRLDLDYIRNQSLWLDIKILFLTIPTVLSGRGAE